MDGIFSNLCISVLYSLARFWSGPQCFLVVWVDFQLTGLKSGCLGRRVAILTNALKHDLHLKSGAGRRKVQVSRASVGDVQRPPVMARAPDLCMEMVCLVTLEEPVALGPAMGLSEGVHQTSRA